MKSNAFALIVALFTVSMITLFRMGGPTAQASVHDFQSDALVLRCKAIVAELIEKDFPELKNVRYEFYQTFDEKMRFNSIFKFSNLLKGHRLYRIGINLNSVPSPETFPDRALRAIMAHELSHTLFYEKLSAFQMAFAWRYLSGNDQRKFERWADEQTIIRGHGQGLAESRMKDVMGIHYWWVDPRVYLSVSEIQKLTAAMHSPEPATRASTN